MSISELFSKDLGANLKNPRWSWGALNPITNQVFLRVWEDELKTIEGVKCILVLGKDWQGTSHGYNERILHINIIKKGATGFGVLCTAKDPKTTGSRSIQKYESKFLLRFGELFDQNTQVYAKIIDRIPVENIKNLKTSQHPILADIGSIQIQNLDVTARDALIEARIGQGQFRSNVLSLWENKCCVTGSKTIEIIRASHIKPWRFSDNKERLDPSNGLPLVATLDALFDAGLITFTENGELKTSRFISSNEVNLLRIKNLGLSKKPNADTQKYLSFHYQEVFRGS